MTEAKDSPVAVATRSATVRARLDAVPALASVLQRGGVLAGAPSGATSLIAWWLRESTQRTVLIVAADAERVYSDCLTWDAGSHAALFPAADTPPFDRVPPSEEVLRRRLATLAALAAGEPLLVATSPQALLRPTLPPDLVRNGITTLKRGESHARDAFISRLVTLGYRRETAVSAPGDFAVRGGIV
ncbi:MAG: hypothetical protein JO152_01525, partial [Mycobacteriaceae bacterium]|nr:hypothetical protein [Mycobacteriaceae bacterium]